MILTVTIQLHIAQMLNSRRSLKNLVIWKHVRAVNTSEVRQTATVKVCYNPKKLVSSFRGYDKSLIYTVQTIEVCKSVKAGALRRIQRAHFFCKHNLRGAICK